MPASTRNYSSTEVTSGPVDIWLNVASPGAGAELTIDSTSNVHTPDSTANPNAIHLGMTTGGCDILYRPTTANSEADELTSPYRSILASEEVVLSPRGVLQFAGGGTRLTLASYLMVGATASTPSGKRKITVGGMTSITFRTVLAIWPRQDDNSKYEYILLYRSYNNAGLAFTLSRKTDASADLAFMGFADTSRAALDQTMQWVVKT